VAFFLVLFFLKKNTTLIRRGIEVSLSFEGKNWEKEEFSELLGAKVAYRPKIPTCVGFNTKQSHKGNC